MSSQFPFIHPSYQSYLDDKNVLRYKLEIYQMIHAWIFVNVYTMIWPFDIQKRKICLIYCQKRFSFLLDVGIQFCCWCHTFCVLAVIIFVLLKMLTREMKRKEQFCSYYRHVESIKFSFFLAIWTILIGLYSFILTFHIKMGMGILLFRLKLNRIMMM